MKLVQKPDGTRGPAASFEERINEEMYRSSTNHKGRWLIGTEFDFEQDQMANIYEAIKDWKLLEQS